MATQVLVKHNEVVDYQVTLAVAGALYAVQWVDALIFGGGRIATMQLANAEHAPRLQAPLTLGGPTLTWKF